MSEPRRRRAAGKPPAAGTNTVTRTRERTKTRQLPPYKVLLHNDHFNDMQYVVRTIQDLTHLGRLDAMQRMLEAHQQGVALLLVTHKERAELYAEQFASKSLTVTIEPA